MKLHVTSQPPVSILLTNMLLIALLCVRLSLGVGGAVPPAAGGGVLSGGEPLSLWELIMRFQLNNPTWSILLTAVIVLVTSSVVGRISTRNMLYAARSLTASPLFVVIISSIVSPTNSLALSLLALFVSYSIHLNFFVAVGESHLREVLYASLMTGSVIALYPPSLPIALIAPFVITLLRRTAREQIVVLSVIFLPLFLYLYVYWLAGYRFMDVAQGIYQEVCSVYTTGFVLPQKSTLYLSIPIAVTIILASLSLPTLGSYKYKLESQSKMLILFVFTLIAALSILFGGGFQPMIAISSVAIALMANRFLVSIKESLASLIYVVVIVIFTLVELLIQCLS